MFEIKTRATAPLRYDIMSYIDYLDYEIVKSKGVHSSYEREFYDLVRGGFLKYIMQMKIGQMQGAAIAYHNTQRIFGFEYISLEHMENRVFGCKAFSDLVFSNSISLVEKVLDFIMDDHSEEDNKVFKMGFYANEFTRMLTVMVEIFDDDELYNQRLKDHFLPAYMQDPIDYYITHKI